MCVGMRVCECLTTSEELRFRAVDVYLKDYVGKLGPFSKKPCSEVAVKITGTFSICSDQQTFYSASTKFPVLCHTVGWVTVCCYNNTV